MEERSWWDLWNGSFRAEDDKDEVSRCLFTHVVSVFQEITQGRPGRVLEVACGTGTLSRGLRFSSYHGLDLSPAAIEIARQKTETLSRPPDSALPTYEAADFHEWTAPADPFDTVLCIDAISCFRDQALVTRKMAQCVRPGGFVLITSVNPFVYNRIRRPDGGRVQNGPVAHWLTRRELHSLIFRAGLKLERSYTIMPRGNVGMLRLINSRRLNQAVGPRGASVLQRLKEQVGLGQYRVIVARKGI